MTDNNLTTILEEAEHIAEQHDQVARTAANQGHEYLRYATLRILEGQTDHLPKGWTPIDYPAQETCTRFRVFLLDDHQTVPRTIVDVMAALGAWRVWTGSAAACSSYGHREYREVHYLWPEGYPVEERHNSHP